MTEKPQGKLQDKIDIAVDSIIQLSLGAQPLPLQIKLEKACHYCIDKIDKIEMKYLHDF